MTRRGDDPGGIHIGKRLSTREETENAPGSSRRAKQNKSRGVPASDRRMRVATQLLLHTTSKKILAVGNDVSVCCASSYRLHPLILCLFLLIWYGLGNFRYFNGFVVNPIFRIKSLFTYFHSFSSYSTSWHHYSISIVYSVHETVSTNPSERKENKIKTFFFPIRNLEEWCIIFSGVSVCKNKPCYSPRDAWFLCG